MHRRRRRTRLKCAARSRSRSKRFAKAGSARFSTDRKRRTTGVLQRIAVEETRLRIPLLFAADVIHGFRTIFPVPLAEASSFDPALAERTARAAASEATAEGLAWNFAPMVDISRDARWGRGVEGAGEDVLLGRLFAAARVRGFQGPDGLADPTAMLATPKHFAAYGAALGGLDYNSVDISERTLRETYFPPFLAALGAGAGSVMAAFNDINGVPAHANPWLLGTVLRDEWSFQGLVVSDFTGDMELIAHGFAASPREAAKLAFLAGVDMSMVSGLYVDHLPDLVRSGEVPEAIVDRSVRRVLELKQRLGLFENPFGRLTGDDRRWTMRLPIVRSPAKLLAVPSCCSRITACCRLRSPSAVSR
jgi:beta-glucosidase